MIAGYGLHSGRPATVRFVREAGPVRFCGTPISELVPDGVSRSTSVVTRRGRVGTVEHLFAALAGAGVRHGVSLDVEGPEVPLADGGARAFFDALARLELEPSPPTLVVARAAMIDVEGSIYEFHPGAGIELEVEVDFDPRLERRARWSGDLADFRDRIATARTFGFDHEVEHLLARGLANHITPASVVVVCQDRILSAGAPFEADEPARHKLLDMIGDLYVHGGPPRGSVRATRPGHAATHEAMRRAVMDGVLID